jgi:uncharacterized protein YigE (DUF2233 family)
MLPAMIPRVALLGLLAFFAIANSRDAHAVTCRQLGPNGSAYLLCEVDVSKERLTLHLTDSHGDHLGGFEALRTEVKKSGRTLTFAMNAGMFHPDFNPVGLLVIDGKTLAPLNHRSGTGNFFLQPNGVFMVDANGARVLATGDYLAHRDELRPLLATQSGPLLVHEGRIPDTLAFSSKSRSRHVRNGVCARTPQIVAFVITQAEVTLREFASFFLGDLGCGEALYLDGTISSLYSPPLKRDDDHAKLGPMFAVDE